MRKDRTPLVLPFRALVPSAEWDRLTAYRPQTYLPGTALLTQGDPGTHVLALKCGLVKVVRVDRDGRRRLLAFRGAGEILGEMAVQCGGIRTASVWAMSICKASVVLAEDFRRLVQRPELAGRLAVMASHRLWEQTEIHDGTVSERLALALLRLVDSSDGPDPSGGRTPTFSLTRDDLAQHLNVGRKAVTKAPAVPDAAPAPVNGGEADRKVRNSAPNGNFNTGTVHGGQSVGNYHVAGDDVEGNKVGRVRGFQGDQVRGDKHQGRR